MTPNGAPKRHAHIETVADWTEPHISPDLAYYFGTVDMCGYIIMLRRAAFVRHMVILFQPWRFFS